MGRAIAGKRGCGTRVAGGCYVESGTSDSGVPIEFLLLDPCAWLGNLGRSEWYEAHRTPIVVEHDGVNHLVIWVGEEYYPNVFDFIEETRVLGASRRLPSGFDFSQITAESRMIFVHPTARRDATAINMLECPCPRNALRGALADMRPAHRWHSDLAEPEPFCIGASLYVPKADIHKPGTSYDPVSGADITCHLRQLPCGHTYRVYELPDVVQVADLNPKPAVFLQLPITGICMVNEKDGSFDPKIEERVRKAGVDTFRADE
jgi:hypothetical protein